MNRKNLSLQTKQWARENQLNIGIYNILIMVMILLRSVGYFHPYLDISVNLIVLFALIVAIFLFKAKSYIFFLISLAFLLFAGFIKMAKVDIWAERTSIYVFQSLLIGTILFIIENVNWKIPNLKKFFTKKY